MAQFEALQKLIGEARQVHVSATGRARGPRETFDTTTSGPSFGHIHHRDGMPTSRHVSIQPEPYGSSHMIGNAMFHIPFGGNIGIPLPRAPIMLGRFSTAGLIHDPALSNVHVIGDSPETKHKRSDRSAFVESVTDVSPSSCDDFLCSRLFKLSEADFKEQDPTTRQDRSRVPTLIDTVLDPVEAEMSAEYRHNALTDSARPGSRGAQSVKVPLTKPIVAKDPDSEMQRQDGYFARTHRPSNEHGVTQLAASSVPRLHAEIGKISDGRPITHTDIENDLFFALEPMYGPTLARQIAQSHSVESQSREAPGRLLSPAVLHTPVPGVPSMTSHMPTQGTVTPDPHGELHGSRIPSLNSNATMQGSPGLLSPEIRPAPVWSPTTVSSISTTPSNVKHIVAESKFHDETLCQLLDAARLNLIGEEAKKALNRAARARVIELRDMRANGEVS